MSLEDAQSVACVEPRTSVRAFETLRRTVLAECPSLIPELRACGYDPEKTEGDFPSEVWIHCLEIARAHLFAELPSTDGMRALAKLTAPQVRNSLLAQVDAAVPYTGEEYVRRLPYLITLARPDLEARASFEAPHEWALSVRGRFQNADYMAGLIEATLHARGIAGSVEVARSEPDGYRLRVLLGAPAAG